MINPFLQSIIVGIIIFFIVTLSYLVLKKKIRERDSALWYLLLFILLFFSIFYKFIDFVAEKFNIIYPLSLLFLLGILTLFAISFYHSHKISKLTNRLTELSQQLALRTHLNQQDKEIKRKS